MSGNKPGLASFLKTELTKPVEPVAMPELTPAVQTTMQEVPKTPLKQPKTTKSVTNRVTDSVTPRYLTLSRKETRLRDEQYNELTNLARSLNRQKELGGERITENTLIRVAIDLLLAKASHLTGSTEEELLMSATKSTAEKN